MYFFVVFLKKRVNCIKKGCNVTTIWKYFVSLQHDSCENAPARQMRTMFSLHSLNRILVALINIFRDI